MRETDTHIFFYGTYMSNFAWQPFECEISPYGKMRLNTSEHAFMIIKAATFDDHNTARLMRKAPDGASVKALGRKVVGFDPEHWNEVSYGAMLFACRHKFQQNPLIKYELIETGSKVLVEASPTDCIWGIGLAEHDDRVLNEANWRGENRLGKVLTEVRKELQDEVLHL